MARDEALVDWVTDRLATVDVAAGPLPERPDRAVVGVDGFGPGKWATAWAARWASELDLVFALGGYQAPRTRPVGKRTLERWKQTFENDAMVAFHSVRGAVGGAQVHEHVVNAGAAAALLDTARENAAGLVAVGRAGGGVLDRLVLGSVSEGVVHHADRPCLVAKDEPTDGPVVVGVGTDEASSFAAAWGTAIARWDDRRLVLVHATTHDDRRERFPATGPGAEAVAADWPPRVGVSQVAQEHNAALVVVGHGRRPGWLGSSAIGVVRDAPCSVLVARSGAVR